MLEIARVVAAHPESNAVDLYLMKSGRRVAGVQVLTPMAGTDMGSADLPSPEVTDPQAQYETGHTQRDVYAVVGCVAEFMVVIGFLFPQVAECLFAEQNRKVYRHASDVYWTIDQSGNTELFHPSGSFVRIGETPAHEDLTGLDYDGQWKIDRNTDKTVHLSVEIRNGGELKAKLTIDPDGNAVINTDGTLDILSGGNISISSGGDIAIDADGNIALTATRIDLN